MPRRSSRSPAPAPSELGCYGPADMGDRERIHRERVAAGAIYGTVVYLTILVLLEEDRTDP